MTKMIMAAVLAFSFSAFAADAEKSDSTTVDHSKTLMGAKKTVVTKKSKKKGEDGSEMTTKTTDTTKVHKDGKVEKSTETSTDSESK